jgi:tetratricopeptide (TPR) repeat protein
MKPITILAAFALLLTSTAAVSLAVETAEPADHTSAAQLEKELARLDALRAELEALETAPLPVVKELASPGEKAEAAKLDGLPEMPVKGTEEAFADTLYRLGRCDKAQKVYQQLTESEGPASKDFAWIQFQLGNCARKTGDYVSAIAAYETVMNASPDAHWAREAAWWSGHLKWLLVWKETMKNDGGPGVVSIP